MMNVNNEKNRVIEMNEQQAVEFTGMLKVKKPKEYKIGFVVSCVSLILLCMALTIGVVRIDTSIEKVCFLIGISLNCLGFMFLNKAKEMNDIKDM